MFQNQKFTRSGSTYRIDKGLSKPDLIFFPKISYSTNLNGGNPDKDLILGDYTFIGDKNPIAKQGILVGAGVAANMRYIYGEGRFLLFNLHSSYDYSFDHQLGVNTFLVNLYSKNHLRNWSFIDICLNNENIKRKLSENITQFVDLNISKIIQLVQNNDTLISTGLRHLKQRAYNQNLVYFGIDTKFANKKYSDLKVFLGSLKTGNLSEKLSISFSFSQLLFEKPIKLSLDYKEAIGGQMLNYKRNDKTYGFKINYIINPNLSFNLGYNKTNSTIKYFNLSQPILNIQFSSIKF